MGGFLVAVPLHGQLDAATVGAALTASAPRGPDGVNHVVTPDGVLLVQCHFVTMPEQVGERLPLVDPTGSVFLVKHGFLANIEQLRGRLRDRLGNRISLRSDADVMLAAYLAWGQSMVDHLVGEFAFAIWDSRTAHVFASRDHLGSRPMLVHSGPDLVVIGSEFRQLLAFPSVGRGMDEYAVADYFSGYPEELRRSVFAEITRVTPGASVSVSRSGTFSERVYWQPRVNTSPTDDPPEAFAAEVFEITREAVRSRLRSTGPVVCQLSGGLDSSSILGLAATIARETDGLQPLRAYSLLYPGLDCDESPYINAVLDKWPVPWTGIDGLGAPAPDRLDELRRDLLFPLESLSNTLLEQADLMKTLGSRVMLTGRGGDSVFFSGGLPMATLLRYPEGRRLAWERSGRSPRVLLRMIRRYILRPAVPSWLLDRYLARKDVSEFSPVLTDKARALLEANRPPAAKNPLERLVAIQIVSSLVQFGVAAGAAIAPRLGFEARHPLEDVRLIDFVLQLPPSVHQAHGGWRTLQKCSLGGVLPPLVLARMDKAEFSALGRVITSSERDDLPDDLAGLVHIDLLRQGLSELRQSDKTRHFAGPRFEIDAVRAVAEWQQALLDADTADG